MKLFLEKRGCDFREGDQRAAGSDMGNYRLVCEFIGKDGRRIFCELTMSAEGDRLCAEFEYEHRDGTGRRLNVTPDFTPTFTQADVLRLLNSVSATQYDGVEIVDRLPDAARDYPADVKELARAYSEADHKALVDELAEKIAANFHEWSRASDCSFRTLSDDEYKQLTLLAFRGAAARYGVITEDLHDVDEKLKGAAWLAHIMADHLFEEQAVIDPYADMAFLEKLRELSPYYVGRYMQEAHIDSMTALNTVEPDELAAILAYRETLELPTQNAEGVHVGDLFGVMWGWEQTNWNFFQVVALRGEHTIQFRALRERTVSTGDMREIVRPIRDAFADDKVYTARTQYSERFSRVMIRAPKEFGDNKMLTPVEDLRPFDATSYA